MFVGDVVNLPCIKFRPFCLLLRVDACVVLCICESESVGVVLRFSTYTLARVYLHIAHTCDWHRFDIND